MFFEISAFCSWLVISKLYINKSKVKQCRMDFCNRPEAFCILTCVKYRSVPVIQKWTYLYIWQCMLKKVRHILITLVILFISSIVVDEGKTIMLIGEDLIIHLAHGHHNDLQIPHQHVSNKTADDEKLMSSIGFDLSCPHRNHYISLLIFRIIPQDYTSLIWQPPRSI